LKQQRNTNTKAATEYRQAILFESGHDIPIRTYILNYIRVNIFAASIRLSPHRWREAGEQFL